MSRRVSTAATDVLDALRQALRGREPSSGASEPTGTVLPDGGSRGDADDDDEHLRDVPDGAGCTEIWEHLSETHRTPEAECDD